MATEARPSQIADAAADYLSRRGWAPTDRDVYADSDLAGPGPISALAALGIITGGDPHAVRDVRIRPVLEALALATEPAAPHVHGLRLDQLLHRLSRWNDRLGQTTDSAVAALREAARMLRGDA